MAKTSEVYPEHRVLLVDDEVPFLRTARLTLLAAGITNIEVEADSRRVLDKISQVPYSTIALDISMPHTGGVELLERIRQLSPDSIVVMITGFNDVETAVGCMQKGAFDYLVKPVNKYRLITAIQKALSHCAMQRENQNLKEYLLGRQLSHPHAFEKIITRNQTMLKIFEYAEAIARSRSPVLITGETGTGKELIAQAVHAVSAVQGPFVPVNIAGLDEGMFSDTLFGHARGAYTGADAQREGLLAKASGGTLFLDEIGDLSTAAQQKLLRLIQEGEYYPLGSDTTMHSTARIIVATNRNIADPSRFRSDLYFRLKMHKIDLPPLRKRKEDLELLAGHYFTEATQEAGKASLRMPRGLVSLLATYSFPGNIRELEGILRDLVHSHTHGPLSLQPVERLIHEPDSLQFDETSSHTAQMIIFPEHLPTLKEIENQTFSAALQRAGGNKTIAANILGITRQTLSNKLKSAPGR
ncbi:MAG: response regulator [Chitinivibrionales bacterium]|nr:response regulator [Chitinivibrionales bacterium]